MEGSGHGQASVERRLRAEARVPRQPASRDQEQGARRQLLNTAPVLHESRSSSSWDGFPPLEEPQACLHPFNLNKPAQHRCYQHHPRSLLSSSPTLLHHFHRCLSTSLTRCLILPPHHLHHPFHSFGKYLWSLYYVPGTLIATENTAANKTHASSQGSPFAILTTPSVTLTASTSTVATISSPII